jgi:branched-chain amino acid transport system substrate-binding protein
MSPAVLLCQWEMGGDEMAIKATRRAVLMGAAGMAMPLPLIRARAQTANPYDVGFLMPLTGGSGKLGNMMMAGATLAVDQINQANGIDGRPIRLLPEDSQALAKNGIDGYRKLVDVNGARVIITGWTAVVTAIAPLAQQDKAFLLSASTASPAVRGLSPYFQSTWMYADDSAEQILPYARNKLNVKKLAILTVVSDLGTGISKAVQKSWKALGGELTIEETHQIEESNFRAVMLKMIAAGPEAIYVTTSNGKQSAQIVKQARELAYKGYFVSYGAFEDPEILTIGDKADGSYFSTPAFDATAEDQRTRDFVKAFSAKFGSTPNVHQANHWDVIYLYAAVVRSLLKSGKEVSGENFRDGFKAQFRTYQGVGGDYAFNFDDGSVRRSEFVKTIKDGRFVKVADLN